MILAIAVAIIALYLFAQYVRRTSMFVPSRFPEGTWDTRSLAVEPEDVTFTVPGGLRLHGWLFRAEGPLLVYCHGNAGNITDRAPIAANLARRGIAVLLFDWRGYGKSEGRPSESHLLSDAIAAYDFAATIAPHPALRSAQGHPLPASRGEGIPAPIAVYGESLGGPYAAYIAAHRTVTSVVIENSFPSLAAMGNVMYYPLPLGWFAPFALNTVRWLNEAGVPVLVMHGKRDVVIPFTLGMQLFEGLRVPKELLVSETAGHCDIANTDAARYYDTVVRFVKNRRP